MKENNFEQYRKPKKHSYLKGYIQTQLATTAHKFWVLVFISKFCACLFWRGIKHDLSKYSKEEADGFARSIFDLKSTTYGSAKYKRLMKEIKPSIVHHYSLNSHHPQYYEDGVDGMDLLDVCEMICDWQAAVLRMDDGDIHKSLDINKERFKISDQLHNIFKNQINR